MQGVFGDSFPEEVTFKLSSKGWDKSAKRAGTWEMREMVEVKEGWCGWAPCPRKMAWGEAVGPCCSRDEF